METEKIKIHTLKTVQPYYGRVLSGQKTFDLRLNDRDFQTGDKALLVEYDSENNTFSGKQSEVEITYVLREFKGIEKNYCVFGFKVIKHWG